MQIKFKFQEHLAYTIPLELMSLRKAFLQISLRKHLYFEYESESKSNQDRLKKPGTILSHFPSQDRKIYRDSEEVQALHDSRGQQHRWLRIPNYEHILYGNLYQHSHQLKSMPSFAKRFLHSSIPNRRKLDFHLLGLFW